MFGLDMLKIKYICSNRKENGQNEKVIALYFSRIFTSDWNSYCGRRGSVYLIIEAAELSLFFRGSFLSNQGGFYAKTIDMDHRFFVISLVNLLILVKCCLGLIWMSVI